MPHSKEKQQQFNEYNRNHYDMVSARFLKNDNIHSLIKEAAAQSGVKTTWFIKCAIEKAIKEVLFNDKRSYTDYLEAQKPALKTAKYKPKKKRSVLDDIKGIKAEQSSAQQDVPKLERKKARSNENKI